MSAGAMYVMSPDEIVRGYVFGLDADTAAAPDGAAAGITPRQALEQAVLPALQRAPCGVAFSGGRDSSAVLAVAAGVARREGLPDPIPLTLVYPGDDDADETGWQELVVRHLGLDDWQRIVIEDELDLVGPLAVRHLREHGVVWPPTIASDTPMVEAVRGGALLDGEGGDEVLGDAVHRIAPVAHVVRRRRPFNRRVARAAVLALGPARVRQRELRRSWALDEVGWLREPALDELLGAIEQVERTRPLSFCASLRLVPRQRHHVLAARNRCILAAQCDVDVSSPLVRPEVVGALARAGGWLGPGDRTAALRASIPDLLPDAVLARTSKAIFNGCYMAGHTREFAAQWSGEGVEPALVDVEALRREWLGERPHMLSGALLQRAWLASHITATATAG